MNAGHKMSIGDNSKCAGNYLIGPGIEKAPPSAVVRNLFSFLLTACLLIVIYFLVVFTVFKKQIVNECSCYFDGEEHNFCYQMPDHLGPTGTRFSCKYAKILNELGILRPVNSTGQVRVPPVLVTAVSADYFEHGVNLIRSYQAIFDQAIVAVYDIGLTPEQQQTLKHGCNVHVEKFNFSAYPEYFRHLKHYRWKPVVLAMARKKYGHVIYADSIVEFRTSQVLHVPNRWKTSRPFMLTGNSGQSIYSATMPSIYKYIPTNLDQIKAVQMYDAGFIYLMPTADKDQILKWLVLCALEENCLVPRVNYPVHDCSNDIDQSPPNCHRFDQSALNVLLHNAHAFKKQEYVYTRPSNENPLYFYKRRLTPQNPILKTCIF